MASNWEDDGAGAELDRVVEAEEGVEEGPDASERPEMASHPGAARRGGGSLSSLFEWRFLPFFLDDPFGGRSDVDDDAAGGDEEPVFSTLTEDASISPSLTLTSRTPLKVLEDDDDDGLRADGRGVGSWNLTALLEGRPGVREPERS